MLPPTTLKILSASLWDLRSQCEQQVRSLKDAQALTEEISEDPTARVTPALATDIANVLKLNVLVREVAQDCEGLVQELPAAAAAPKPT